MFLRELSGSPGVLRGVGPSLLQTLSNSGIYSIASLLTRYPRDWEDRSRTVLLKDWAKGPVCTTVKILAQDWFGFGAMKTLKIHVADESARGVLICFNRPFLRHQLAVGSICRLWGRFYYKYGELQSTAFETGAEGKSKHFGNILPVYPLSGELSGAPVRSQNLLRRLIRTALEQYGNTLEDELPPDLIRRDSLLSKAKALWAIHFPPSMETLELARKTLIFEELFYLEILVGKQALERKKTPRAAKSSPDFSPLQTQLLDRLSFHLSPGQKTAVAEINADLSGPYPMARLLQGDVGSGKTLVAFLAALKVIEGGGQAAIMAPTELLARQHAENAARLLEPLGVKPAYLTGKVTGKTGRAQLLKALEEGDVDIVLGTHALFSKDVIYRNLRLVIIDEQHRFGVTQRQAIVAKGSPGDTPDILMMSATPIPRTLALTVFGDLDVSVITGMPPGRKAVKTHLAKESNVKKVYDFVGKELERGSQAYFVYPLIGEEETETEEAAADSGTAALHRGLRDAVSMAGELERIFPRHPVALIHSKLEDEQKRAAMESFRRGDAKILAATSVVEVGVDVPNASCMVIHHAERFGLAALHQLRGRVGRGKDQAYCFLVYSENYGENPGGETSATENAAGEKTGASMGPLPPGEAQPALTEEGKRRLRVMLESNDGFVIAEEDLKLRGPGQIAGFEQSGYLKLGIADPVRDVELLIRARNDAFAILEADPAFLLPEHRPVAEVLERAPPFTEVGV
ncbi:MAG: ATP-dependent DNA helicase RecG [Spirochaetaceae bacterium]|jgi:ATP-dependent DNA helicase RecG|nr:ATP-dependent DNA helicase RecG [Spirochaetaceae bacterium]